MNLYKIPVINPDIFVFWMYFYGDDCRFRAGERHFLEHLLLGSNAVYDKESYRKEIAKLGDDSLFSPATSTEFITLSGSYLIEDANRVVQLLNLMLNDASLLEDEIENEREIIVQEYKQGIDDLIGQCYISLGEMLKVELTAIGSLESINQMEQNGLRAAYKGMLNSGACEIYTHGEGVDEIFSHLALREGERSVTPFKPQGNYYAKNDKITSSLVMLMYDEPFSLKSSLLTSYLGAVNGPLFTELREKQQLCYMVSAFETFCGKKRCPFMTTYGVTSKDPELLVKGLHDNFIIEDRDVFDSMIKGNRLNYARVKTQVEERLAMEKQAQQLGVTFEELANWPSWEEFREYAYAVKDKGVHATMVVESGKKEDDETQGDD